MKHDDSIETFIRQWKKERPDLDPWPVGIIGRAQRINARLQARTAKWLEPLDLTWESFSLLVALRRSGEPFELRPTEIYRESLLSSAAITNRIDRVEKKGWVTRDDSPGDRRGVIVRLTPAGRKLADKAIEIHLKELSSLFGKITKKDRQILVDALADLLRILEEQEG